MGQLRASFASAIVRPDKVGACKDGVDVTIGVTEGSIYRWDKADWSGNQALDTKELESALGMKSGDIANGLKFDKGVANAQHAYGRKGYINAFIRTRPEFNEQEKTVVYQLEINEGQQYRMGRFDVKGFPDHFAALLRTKWALRPGDVYDADYLAEFNKGAFREVLTKLAEERRSQGQPSPTKIELRTVPNRSSLTVDVFLSLGD